MDGRSLGKHDLIVRFARRLKAPRPPLVPSWDLSIVLVGLQSGTFEPLYSLELKFLSARTVLHFQRSLPPVGASSQLGKEQALSRAEKLFSQYGVRLGEFGGAFRFSFNLALTSHADGNIILLPCALSLLLLLHLFLSQWVCGIGNKADVI